MSYFRLIILIVAFICAPMAVLADPLDINSASQEQLTTHMVGIGPSKAMAIVEFRGTHGPFSSIDELVQVKGIGERTVELNRERITAQPLRIKK